MVFIMKQQGISMSMEPAPWCGAGAEALWQPAVDRKPSTPWGGAVLPLAGKWTSWRGIDPIENGDFPAHVSLLEGSPCWFNMKYRKDLVDCDFSYVTEEYCHAMHVLHLLHAFLISFFLTKSQQPLSPILFQNYKASGVSNGTHCPPFNGSLKTPPRHLSSYRATSTSRNSCEPRSWELWELAPWNHRWRRDWGFFNWDTEKMAGNQKSGRLNTSWGW